MLSCIMHDNVQQGNWTGNKTMNYAVYDDCSKRSIFLSRLGITANNLL